ncbi:MAG: hypothetical protein P8188_17865, partial [Gemmatimonadota bacterium]
MMRSRRGWAVAALAGLAVWACTEQNAETLDPDVITGPAEARVPSECATDDLARAARGFFANPEQRDVTETLRGIADACAAGDGAGVVNGGWSIFATVESALNAGTTEDPEDGTVLVNGLFGLMCAADQSLCQAPAACDVEADRCASPPDPMVAEVFGEGGIFAVRADDMEPILARGVVPFVDFEGDANDGLWVLTTTAPSWAEATNTYGPVLIYGRPSSYTELDLDEVPFEDLAVELHSFPDVDRFDDGRLHVGICFENDVEIPHVGGLESNPTRVERLQREGTLLQTYTGLTGEACAAFRGTLPGLAFSDGPLGRLLAGAAQALLPRPLFAALVTDRRTPLSSGSPIDFSTIAPVAADPSGRLVFVDPPQNGNAGIPLPVIRVQALSGGGTPLERVAIQLVVAGNEGEPAGASFCPEGETEDCGDIEFTVEELDGYGTLAEFDQATLYKPG